MRCIRPFTTQGGAFGCGQCLPCRVQKRRTWAHRILLEATDHGFSNCSFVTLTYQSEKRSLDPVDLSRWIKRFRKRIGPRKVRFFAIGEYGDITWRPHYHVALFGHPACCGGARTALSKGYLCQCPACSDVRETWGIGHVMVGHLTEQSAQYIAGYCTKKMTHSSDTRLNGRYPEFSRMSLRPGIGASAMHNVASDMMKFQVDQRGIPFALRYGGKLMPLGKYLRKNLKKMVGQNEEATIDPQQKAAMLLLRSYAFTHDRSVASVFAELNQPYADQLAARQNRKVKVL